MLKKLQINIYVKQDPLTKTVVNYCSCLTL